jgi:HEAT repeat protein
VQAAAVKTLARTSFPGAYDVIRSALITPSHRDVIRQAAFEALPFVNLAAGDGLALALQYTPTDQSTEVRVATIGYLQTIANDSRAALEHLIFLLTDEDIRVRGAAISSLASVALPRARTALQKHLDVEVQPSLRLAIEQLFQIQPESPE